MKKISKTVFLMSIALATLMYSCSQDDSTPTPAPTPVIPTPTPSISYPSPCTSTLTNNQAVCTPNVFPGLTLLPLTAVLSNDSLTVQANVVASFPKGGNMDIHLASVIKAGEYGLEQGIPNLGKATLTFIPIYGNNYSSTSGTLYITETATQWVLEWCSINCNSTSSSTSCTGKMLVNK